MSWTDNATNETSFQIQRSSDGGTTFPALVTIPATLPANPGVGAVTYTDTTSFGANTYIYQVMAVNAIGNSAPQTRPLSSCRLRRQHRPPWWQFSRLDHRSN